MGCDIHGYIEYEKFVMQDGTVYRSCIGQNLGDRDYSMFGFLAGVRRDGCIFEPRGIPDNLSFTVKGAYYLFVVDGETDSEGMTSRENADRWVNSGISEYIEKDRITHPDWHTASWLTTEEFEQVLKAREQDTEYGNVDQEWYAILAAMKVLKNARFVFWFDN